MIRWNEKGGVLHDIYDLSQSVFSMNSIENYGRKNVRRSSVVISGVYYIGKLKFLSRQTSNYKSEF